MAAAKLVAKKEVAKLKLKQLEEKRELERSQKKRRRAEEEQEEEQFNLELLKARHEMEEASLERQVIKEEIERGGYIPSETKPLESDILTSSRRLLKETQFVSRVREAPTLIMSVVKFIQLWNKQQVKSRIGLMFLWM